MEKGSRARLPEPPQVPGTPGSGPHLRQHQSPSCPCSSPVPAAGRGARTRPPVPTPHCSLFERWGQVRTPAQPSLCPQLCSAPALFSRPAGTLCLRTESILHPRTPAMLQPLLGPLLTASPVAWPASLQPWPLAQDIHILHRPLHGHPNSQQAWADGMSGHSPPPTPTLPRLPDQASACTH